MARRHRAAAAVASEFACSRLPERSKAFASASRYDMAPGWAFTSKSHCETARWHRFPAGGRSADAENAVAVFS